MYNDNIIIVNNTHKDLKGYQFIKVFNSAIYLIVLIANIIGNLVFYYTITTQFILTLSYTFNIISKSVLSGISVNYKYYSGNLLPSNVPLIIAPLLISIELLSLISKIISLAVRLSSNLISGHTLVHLITNFLSYLSINNTAINYTIDISILIITALISVLSTLILVEIFISIVQAYVFLLLTIAYTKDNLIKH